MAGDLLLAYLNARARRGDCMTYRDLMMCLPHVVVTSDDAWLVPGSTGARREPAFRLTANVDPEADFVAALKLLRRNGGLLRSRFGLHWSDVANALRAEAARRGFSMAGVARLLMARLRADEGAGA
jgi:hypothetical protein